MEDYRSKGYLKEAIVNFVAFLGWNPGDEREIFTMEQLVKEFTLERVGKSGAVFNIEKLNWMNFEHLRRKSDTEVLAMLKEYLAQTEYKGNYLDDEYLLKVLTAMRERINFVNDFVEKSPYFFGPPKEYDAAVVKKRWKKETPWHLKALVNSFESLQNPSKVDYEKVLQNTAEELKIGPGDIIHSVRLAVSGVGGGPGLYDILEILGKDETIRRINTAIERIA